MLIVRTKTLATVVMVFTHWREPSWRLLFPSKNLISTQQLIGSNAEGSGQTTNRVGYSFTSADRLPKFFKGKNPIHQRDKIQLHPPVGRNMHLPPRSIHKHLREAPSISGQIAEARGLTMLQPSE